MLLLGVLFGTNSFKDFKFYGNKKSQHRFLIKTANVDPDEILIKTICTNDKSQLSKFPA